MRHNIYKKKSNSEDTYLVFLKKKKYCNPFLLFLFTFLCIFKDKIIKNYGKIINICIFNLKMLLFIFLLNFFSTFLIHKAEGCESTRNYGSGFDNSKWGKLLMSWSTFSSSLHFSIYPADLELCIAYRRMPSRHCTWKLFVVNLKRKNTVGFLIVHPSQNSVPQIFAKRSFWAITQFQKVQKLSFYEILNPELWI